MCLESALLSRVLRRWGVRLRSVHLLNACLGGVLDALVGIGHYNVQNLVHRLVRCGSLDEGEGQVALRLWQFGHWLIILLFHGSIIGEVVPSLVELRVAAPLIIRLP